MALPLSGEPRGSMPQDLSVSQAPAGPSTRPGPEQVLCGYALCGLGEKFSAPVTSALFYHKIF